jgi:DNA-binding NtrC family response regulator
MDRLLGYSYPGNVRELQNIVSALLIEARGGAEITEAHVGLVFSRHRLEAPGPAPGVSGPAPSAGPSSEGEVGAWVLEQLRLYHFNIALAERMLLARKRGAPDPRSVPVCSRSGLTYYLQGEGFRALAEAGWNLSAAASRLAGESELASRVESKLSRFLDTARSSLTRAADDPDARRAALEKAFAKLPQSYEKDLTFLCEEYEKGRWS